MSRRDKQADQKQRRLLDEVHKGISRGDAALAVDALLRLPIGDRGPWLAGAADLTACEVGRLRERKDPLHAWAVRVTAETRLLDHALGRDTAWELLWAAAATRDWPRVRSLAARAVPDLHSANDPWSTSLAAWLDAEGQPEASAFHASLPDSLTQLLETKTDTSQVPPVELPPPRHAADAEDAVLTAWLTLPWRTFAQTVQHWCARLPAPLAEACSVTAARLATREALRRHLDGDARWADPIDLLFAMALAVRPTPLPASDVATVLRLCRLALPADTDLSAQPPDVLQSALQLGAAHREWAAVAVDLVVDVIGRYDGEPVAPGWLDLLARANAGIDDARLPWLALIVLQHGDADALTAPKWLVDALAHRAAADGADFIKGAQSLSAQQRNSAIDALAEAVPVDVAADVIDVCWPGWARTERTNLGDAILSLCERASVRMPERFPGSRAGLTAGTALLIKRMLRDGQSEAAVLDELEAICGTELGPRAALRDFVARNRLIADGGPAAPQAHVVWHRFAERLVPYDEEFLEFSLRMARDDADLHTALRAWFASRRTHADIHCAQDARLEIVPRSDVDVLALAQEALQSDVAGLAGLLEHAQCTRRPIQARRQLAERLLGALASHVGARTEEIEDARRLAQRLLAPKQAREKQAPTGTRRKSEPKKPRARKPVQNPLPFEDP